MIIGSHALIYVQDADAARAFFRDVLALPHVDAHDGWLIFKLPPAELAVHPVPEGGAERPGGVDLYLMCDDLAATAADLTAKGVEFTAPVTRQRWGLLTTLAIPGGGELGLYQPTHPTAFDL